LNVNIQRLSYPQTYTVLVPVALQQEIK